MNKPFQIFPNIGYRNSQFQIVSSVENLIIDIYNQEKLLISIETNLDNPTLLTNIKSTGKLTAKCKHNGEIFQQEIEIKEAIRLGSSEFKKAYVFDDSEYSFFLMKDRLLLYDEQRKQLLTENHFSPSEIFKINKNNYLFVTKVGGSANGIINLGIYNTGTFTIVSELLNAYREIKIIPETNKAWLYNIQNNSIHCFELVHDTKRYFTELRHYTKFKNFFIDHSGLNIFINYADNLKISNLGHLHNAIEIPKLSNNAIDKLGNLFSIENDSLICTKQLADYTFKIKLPNELNLQGENFIHVGNELKSNIALTNLNQKVDEIKDYIISSIPENNTYHHHILPEFERIIETYAVHNIYPTQDGIFLVVKEVTRNFNGIIFKKHQTNWTANAFTTEIINYSLLFLSSSNIKVLIYKEPSFTVTDYKDSILFVNSQNTKTIFSGCDKFTVGNENSVKIFSISDISYLLIKSKEKYYDLYQTRDLNKPILNNIEILNYPFIEIHQIIWYTGKDKYLSNKNNLYAFDLKVCSRIFIEEQMVQHSIYKDPIIGFYEKYAFSSKNIIFNPLNLEVKDAFIGKLESYSERLNKIVSYRSNIIYLSIFDTQSKKYKLSEITVDNQKFKESYISPNGQFLVLQDETNKYLWYDIEKNETVQFISGNFLAFQKDGSLIVEDDSSRAVKILDPKTFEDITPPNYHHYRFMSPDGKLYAQVASKVRFFNKLTGEQISVNEVAKLRRELDEPVSSLNPIEKELADIQIKKNRQQIFEKHKRKFEDSGKKNHNSINSLDVVKVERYTEIGIVGTQVSTEVVFPEDLQFYNYSAFSYDNRYFGYVGKPSLKGLIHLFKIDFDEAKSKLTIVDTYLSRYPAYASWVCGFSKKGYFATYDSTPDTYIILIDNDLFDNKTPVNELKQNIHKSRFNIYYSYRKWNEIKGKNFLCFSPTGDFLALSEQGYEPLTLGGYGHQESNVVHIAKTETGKIVDSFTGHGDKIKIINEKEKKVIFVAFSEDEKRIMTLSYDGVVFIRDLSLPKI